MDNIDKKVLNYLQNDCTISYQEIADKLQVGSSTIHYRIKKLLKKGIIQSFSAIVNPDNVGYVTTAVVGLNVEPLKMYEIANLLSSFDKVQTVATCSGDHDIILQIIAKDGKDLWKFINEHIKTIEGVDKKIHVSSFLDVYKRTNKINFKTDENKD